MEQMCLMVGRLDRVKNQALKQGYIGLRCGLEGIWILLRF